MGERAFQSLYEPSPGTIDALLLMPEWYLLVLVTVATATVGVFWHPLLRLLPIAAVAVAGSLAGAIAGAVRARFADGPHAGAAGLARRVLTAALHLLQPAARLWGRLSYGLAPWRLQGRLVRLGVPPDERTGSRAGWSPTARDTRPSEGSYQSFARTRSGGRASTPTSRTGCGTRSSCARRDGMARGRSHRKPGQPPSGPTDAPSGS